jgi:dTDP-4-dehydrorhamnose 3,5-epimerase
MIFRETPLAGAFVIEPEPYRDERGYFSRLFCAKSFAAHGLIDHFEQVSQSHNHRRGTLRGLHLQRPPNAEAKLVRAIDGAIYDVIVDLRAGSVAYGKWFGIELSADNGLQLYIPPGFAHGFQSLTNNAKVSYHISAPYVPELQDGILWNDGDLAINWPLPDVSTISARDHMLKRFADFEPIALACC